MTDAPMERGGGADVWRPEGWRPEALRGSGRGAASSMSRLWRERSLRIQIIAVLLLINMAAVAASFVVVVHLAQKGARSEIDASLELAELYVREAVANIKPDVPWQSLAASLPLQLHTPRNVRLMVADAAGTSFAVAAPGSAPPGGQPLLPGDRSLAPEWFAAFFEPGNELHLIRVVLDGRRLTTVVIASTPEQLVADVWEQIKALGLLALAINMAIVAGVYWALGRILQPVSKLGAGLGELEKGHYRIRLEEPKVREVGELVASFNALAGTLEAAQEQNRRLSRRLLMVQDDERRQIAMELHDEAGPCLFGIKASAASLERFGAILPEGDASKLKERVGGIIAIADRLHGMNRRLIRKLRPAALGRVSLGELVADLMLRFERENGETRFCLNLGALAASYGEETDLAVYRSIQEGLANAVRHSGAGCVTVLLGEEDGELRLSVEDDGCGLPEGRLRLGQGAMGLGLTGVRERVGALGGECVIESVKPRGARLSVAVPAGTLSALAPAEETGEKIGEEA